VVAIGVGHRSPVTHLSLDQVRDVFRHNGAQHWNDVGIDDHGLIVPVGLPSRTNAAHVLRTNAFPYHFLRGDLQEKKSAGEIVAAVRTHRNAISFFPYTLQQIEDIRIIDIVTADRSHAEVRATVAPNIDSVANKRYPLVEPQVVVWRDDIGN